MFVLQINACVVYVSLSRQCYKQVKNSIDFCTLCTMLSVDMPCWFPLWCVDYVVNDFFIIFTFTVFCLYYV